MKQVLFSILFVCTLYMVYPQETRHQENSTPGTAISSKLNQFSPLGSIYIRNLGMNDRNSNGVIDECKTGNCECHDDDDCEGFNQFVNSYGIGETYADRRASVDSGFYANSVVYGANNSRLEEPEIINFYQINIRFKNIDVTNRIESAQSAYIYANNIPLVWMDDERGTVMNAVNRVLGTGWNEREVSEDEAVRMFHRVMREMNIRGRTGSDPGRTGYDTLSEFINRRMGYCFEVAQFGYWFFSELKINSMVYGALLTPSLSHVVIELTDSQRRIDYFNGTSGANIMWSSVNPLFSIGEYHRAFSRTSPQNRHHLETILVYNKYDLHTVVSLINDNLDASPPRYIDAIAIGEFFIQNTDFDNLLSTRDLDRDRTRNNTRTMLMLMSECYGMTQNRTGFLQVEQLLNTHFPGDTTVQAYLNYYRP